MKRILTGILFLAIMCTVVASAPVFAADTAEQASPATKFDDFAARKGSLLIKEVYPLGTVMGLYGGQINVEAIALSEPQRETVFAVVLERPATDKYGTDRRGTLDFDELTGVLQAMDYMLNTAPELKAAKKTYTEVIFQTKSGIEIGFMTEKGGDQTAFVQVSSYGSGAMAFFAMKDLARVKDKLESAHAQLVEMGAK